LNRETSLNIDFVNDFIQKVSNPNTFIKKFEKYLSINMYDLIYMSIFIVYTVPWLACEPKDAYEDESAVVINRVFSKEIDARNYVEKYCKEFCDESKWGHYVCKPLCKIDDMWSTWVSNDKGKVKNFNQLNGFAMCIVEKFIDSDCDCD
jgi:hypothetical protein